MKACKPQYDVIIVGGGPAGLSAALILGRCLRRVVLCDSGRPRNAASRGLHGYLSRDGIVPRELIRLGRAEIRRYPVEIRDVAVIDASCARQQVQVRLENGSTLTARKLLLATGVADILPKIEGFRELYGRSVHHCPYCDGWEYRGQSLAVYGAGRAAVGMALSLLTWTRDLVVCTDGRELSPSLRRRLDAHGIAVRIEKIARLVIRGGRLDRIIFKKARPLRRRAIFFSTGQVQRSLLAEKLGCRFDAKGHFITDLRGRTPISNLFLAGDANGDVQFAIVAAAEGATAAVTINRQLQEEDRKEEMARRGSRGHYRHKPPMYIRGSDSITEQGG